MKGVQIEITNNRIPELRRRLPQLVQAIVDKTAFDLQKSVIESMEEPKTGRSYKRGKKGKIHQASAPGEAPAIDTGNLAQIRVEKVSPCVNIVAVHAEYGQALEFGSENGKIAARPFMTPAAEKVKPKFLQALLQLENKLK